MLSNTAKRLSRHFTTPLLVGSCAIALLGNAAYAADLDAVEQTVEPSPSYPLIEGSFVFELESDGIFSDEGNDEFVDTFNTTEVALDVRFNSIFSLHTDITLEPVEDPNAGQRALGDDIFFEDHGFFFETLHLQADFEHFSLYGGKINPSFGSAWDVTPGLYGVDFAEDYEITERIGIGGSYTFKTASSGEHTINAATFFADTSGLSRSFGRTVAVPLRSTAAQATLRVLKASLFQSMAAKLKPYLALPTMRASVSKQLVLATLTMR